MMASDLRITVQNADSALVAALRGDLSVETASRFKDELWNLVSGTQELVVLDLRELAFIDSTGLKAVLETEAKLWPDGCGLSVVRGSGQVDRAFRTTLLDEHLPFFEDVESAIAAGCREGGSDPGTSLDQERDEQS